jgi:small-conductance mechanosensitive channel
VDVAVQLTALLLLIRVAMYVVRVSLGARARIKGWGTPISLILWVFLSLHLLGWGDTVIGVLDGMGVTLGKTRISVWSVAKLIVTVSLFVLAAMWVSRWLERHVLKVDALPPTMRIGIAKFTQAFLVALSVLVGLNAAGLDLTTLNVLTGAIGIGLGFGLQSIAANFVSGFVLLMDRSIKPGDVISFTGTTGTATEGFGWVEELRGRYVVVRDRDGVATLVPNQNLITNSVVNWSYTDPRVRLKLPVRVSYKSDPELAMRLMLESTVGHPRVIQNPAPVARLMSFGDHGIELELRFWIPDPQEGVNNVRSDVNRAIWRLFGQHGIVIPVAQREVRVEMLSPSVGEANPARGD